MLGFGLWWLARAEASARRKGEGFGAAVAASTAADDLVVRERATTSGTFDPAEIRHGHRRMINHPASFVASLPLLVVVIVNLLVSWWYCRASTRLSGGPSVGAERRSRR